MRLARALTRYQYGFCDYASTPRQKAMRRAVLHTDTWNKKCLAEGNLAGIDGTDYLKHGMHLIRKEG